MPNNAQRQREEPQEFKGCLEGCAVMTEEGYWKTQEAARVGKDRESEREAESREGKSEKLSLTGYLYMHLWGPILASNMLSWVKCSGSINWVAIAFSSFITFQHCIIREEKVLAII